MDRDRPVLSTALWITGALLIFVVVEAAGHLLLLNPRLGTGSMEDETGFLQYFQRHPDYHIVGEYGRYLFAPAIAFDQAVRPRYWSWSESGVD